MKTRTTFQRRIHPPPPEPRPLAHTESDFLSVKPSWQEQTRKERNMAKTTTIAIVLGLVCAASRMQAGTYTAYSCWNGNFYSLDLQSGAGTAISSPPGFYHMDFAPDGTLYALSRSLDKLYRFVNPATGQVQLLGDLPGNSTGSGFTVAPTGDLVYFTLGSSLYRYSIGGGTVTGLGVISGMSQPTSIEMAADGTMFAMDGFNWGSKRLYEIDLSTLTASAIGPALLGITMDSGATASSLSFAPDGTLYATIDPTAYVPGEPASAVDNYIGTIDPATGLATIDWGARIHLGAAYYRSDSLAIIAAPTAIPEPATMALLGLAACGLGGYVRSSRVKSRGRRRKA